MTNFPIVLATVACAALVAGSAAAQSVQTTVPDGGQGGRPVAASPSVGDGIANGVVKPSGSPSVGNGVANGVLKRPGSPSVGDGIANGVLKSSTVQQ